MRLLYLDEAGISANESGLCVAGVLVHGDFQSPDIERKLEELTIRHIPESDRQGFVFHSTDIFHGSGYFDRKTWPQITRLQILNDLASIIEELHLPVVAGMYHKDTFGEGVPEVLNADHEQKRLLIQVASALDCAIWAERWLGKYASTENAMIIAEDADRVKKLMKKSIRLFRSPALLKAWGIDFEGLPLKRILDTVHFAAKEECAALQLADLCAFTFGRAIKDKPVPVSVFEILYRHLRWIQNFKPDIKLPELSEITEIVP
jgi:hypothetical protein